jgi:hypothetical protein
MKTSPDSNEKNAVDELFRKALANYEAEASTTAYQKWQSEITRLNKENNRRIGRIWWTLPALLVAGIAMGGYWYITSIENTPSGHPQNQPVVSTEKFEKAKQPSEPLLHLTTEKVRKEPMTRLTATTFGKREQWSVITLPENEHSQPVEMLPTPEKTTAEKLLPVVEPTETAVSPAKEEHLQLEVFIRLGNEASAKGSTSTDTPSAEAVEESNLKRLWKRLNGKEVSKDTSERRVERRILGYPADSLFKKKDKRKIQD